MLFLRTITTSVLALIFLSGSAQDPAFKFLMAGEVQHECWLKTQMQQDIEIGYARHLLQLTDRCHLDVYDVSNTDSIKTGSGGLKGHIWWDGESTGNWLDGFIRIAFLSGNKQAIKEADKMVKTILGYQEKDGYLGTYPKRIRYESPLGVVNKNNGELWNQACLFRGLIRYYELTGKHQVLQAVEKATLLTISMCLSISSLFIRSMLINSYSTRLDRVITSTSSKSQRTPHLLRRNSWPIHPFPLHFVL